MSSDKPANNKPVNEMSVSEISDYVHDNFITREDADAVNERLAELNASHRYALVASSPGKVEAYYV